MDGEVFAQGDAPVTAYGICWGTKPDPTIQNDTTIDGSGIGSFFGQLEGLKVNVKYYARAYATNKNGTAYGETLSFTTFYSIGDVFGGGKIIYIDNTKVHGLIVASEDQSLGSRWDNSNAASWTYASSGTDGAGNTNKIVAKLGNGCAAAICKNYKGGGYNDWFMPATGQLNYLFKAKDKIGNVTPSYYWSSTESTNSIAAAWTTRMDSQNGENAEWTKSYKYVIRAMRAF